MAVFREELLRLLRYANSVFFKWLLMQLLTEYYLEIVLSVGCGKGCLAKT